MPALGLVPGEVVAIPPAPGVRVPHMGWNTLTDLADDPLLTGIEEGEQAYFVHSYAAPVGPHTLATTDHGAPWSAVVRSGLRWGELIALRPVDLDFEPQRVVRVHRAVEQLGFNGLLTLAGRLQLGGELLHIGTTLIQLFQGNNFLLGQ